MQGVTDSESVRDSQQSRLRQPVRRDPLTYYYSRFRYANTLRYQSFVDVHVAVVVLCLYKYQQNMRIAPLCDGILGTAFCSFDFVEYGL